MEALQERQTLSELCKKHNLHPNQISSWKRQLKENSVSVFKEIQAGKDDRDRLIEQLYKTIGEFTMDAEYLKKAFTMSRKEREMCIEKESERIVRHQCVLLGLCRGTLYYTPSMESEENLRIMELPDKLYMETPFYGELRLQA